MAATFRIDLNTVCFILKEPKELTGLDATVMIYKDVDDNGKDFFYVPIDSRKLYTEYKHLHYVQDDLLS